MPNHMSFVVVLTGLSGFALLVLSVIELRKPVPIAKMTGLTWLLFAVAADSLSVSLFIMGETWHLRNAQKPWLLTNALGGIAFVFIVVAFLMLVRVVAAKEAETKREAESTGKPSPPEGVWPPPPTGP